MIRNSFHYFYRVLLCWNCFGYSKSALYVCWTVQEDSIRQTILKSGTITTIGVPKPANATVPLMLSPKGGVKYKILILVSTLARETVWKLSRV